MEATLTQIKDNPKITTDLTKIRDFSELNKTLNILKPANSETAQLITYALIATAVVGIFVYRYIKEQEAQ